MSNPDYRDLANKGLWSNNVALVQLLGLCPLLAVSASVVNALGLGLDTLLVLIGSNACVSLIRNVVSKEIRVPVFVMIIAALVTSVELLMQALAYELYQTLGIFVALIVTNCAILGRAEAFAAKQPLLPSLWDGLMQGLGFTLVLVLLGAIREILSQGTLFAQMDLLFGPLAASWTLTLLPDYRGFLLAALPPGAFIGLGLLIAGKNYFDNRQPRATAASNQVPSPL